MFDEEDSKLIKMLEENVTSKDFTGNNNPLVYSQQEEKNSLKPVYSRLKQNKNSLLPK